MSKTFDRYASLVFMALGVAFLVGSLQIASATYGAEVGPDIFPMALGAVMILLSIRLFYGTFRSSQTEETEKSPLHLKRFSILLAASVLYVICLEIIGYLLATFLFLVIGFQGMQKGKWLTTLLVAAGFSGGIYYLFVEVMKGTLPGFPTWLGG